MELPKSISVHDHVVEPPHVWPTWLPEKHREKGPRVERLADFDDNIAYKVLRGNAIRMLELDRV